MAEHRHKRETSARRPPRAAFVAAPIALLATGSAVTLGVVSSDPVRDLPVAQDASSISGVTRGATTSRSESRLDRKESKKDRRKDDRKEKALQKAVERSARLVATRAAVRAADTRLWTTEVLNLWSGSGEDAENTGEIDAGKRVLVTGRDASGRVEIVVDGESRWVTEGYLSEEKPVAAAAGLSMAPCPDPGVESGLTDDAVYVYRSVCNAFPQITSYGGWDGHGEHASGRALDIMTSDVELGDAIAAFLQANAAELNLYDILWRQRIWTQERSGEGWRFMPSRGSATANHYDHVHVATNG
ncbi:MULTISPECIES: mucin-2 protein [unclassified Nocardioides]|uniref:mucin-2 protein n=1 Tax=unclassified Nocardioides TaxID=2615069 RepID=UPI00360D6D81